MTTLRHIFTAEATPSWSLNGLAFIPILRRRSAASDACGPPSNMGTCNRCLGTGDITAASTNRALLRSTPAAALRLVPGETELMSRKSWPSPRIGPAFFATSNAEEAVTAEITSSAFCKQSFRLRAAVTAQACALLSIARRCRLEWSRMSKTETCNPWRARSCAKMPPASPKPMIATRSIDFVLCMSPSLRNNDRRDMLLALPHACGHQQLASKKRARRSNQARSDHLQLAATMLHLKFNRKFAAGMLDREPLHWPVV